MAEFMPLEGEILLRRGIELKASDIHLTGGQKVFYRVAGKLFSEGKPLNDELIINLINAVTTNEQQNNFRQNKELDFAFIFSEKRLRGNAYKTGGKTTLALRLISSKIPTLEEIRAPQGLYKMLDITQGLILVTGSTGSGKTTTLAAFLQAVCRKRSVHIVTLEDPIEYILQNENSFISQREYGRDFLSFASALRGAVRAMPDLLLVGEIRDYATAAAALNAAEAGILVLGTLHTKDTVGAAKRLTNLFPLENREAVREQLADVLVSIFSQRLIPAIEGGRVALFETLIVTDAVRNILRQGKTEQLPSLLLNSQADGMKSFKSAWNDLRNKGLVTGENFL